MNVWTVALVAVIVGALPGGLFFPFMASPIGPGLWKLSTPFSRIFLTISQIIRGKGVLVKTNDGHYEIGTYVDGEDGPRVQLSDRTVPLDEGQLRWGLFGKRPFATTWEPGTDLHRRIAVDDDTVADGGGFEVNMGALHRFLRGVNDETAITRTEEKAKAEYGLGDDQLSDLTMAVLIGAMLLLGSLTTWLMIG